MVEFLDDDDNDDAWSRHKNAAQPLVHSLVKQLPSAGVCGATGSAHWCIQCSSWWLVTSPAAAWLGAVAGWQELEKLTPYEVPRKLLRKQILDLDKCLSLALKTTVSVIHVLETLRRIDWSTDLLVFPYPSTCVRSGNSGIDMCRSGFVALELEFPGNHWLHRGVFCFSFFVTPWDLSGIWVHPGLWQAGNQGITKFRGAFRDQVEKSEDWLTVFWNFGWGWNFYCLTWFWRSRKIYENPSSIELQFLVPI